MTKRPALIFMLLIGLTLVFAMPRDLTAQEKQEDAGFVPLFNGKDLSGWQRVNTAESTWSVKDGMLICTGKPIGELRTERMYQNFILEVEWRHMKPRGNAGIFVWADDITAKGVPFHRSIEVQVLENAYGNTRGYTTHGDIFPIHGAKMTPVNGRGGSRAFPTENRSNPSPEWNHYRIECVDGKIALAVNHKIVTRGTSCNPRKGYICIESEGGVVHYRNMKIKVLPDTPIDKSMVAIADRGYKTLYDGITLDNWQVEGGWKPSDWRLLQQGDSKGKLTTKESFDEAGFIVDFRTSENLPGFEFRGAAIDLKELKLKNLANGNGWNRLQLDCEADRLAITLNGNKLESTFPMNKERGSLIIVAAPKCELANIYVREDK